MEKLSPKELAKNNKQTINNPRMENKSEDTPRTKISRFKQSFKASQRILKSKPILEKIGTNHKISKCNMCEREFSNFQGPQNGFFCEVPRKFHSQKFHIAKNSLLDWSGAW